MKKVKIGYILSYYDVDYIRTRVILNALEKIPGIEVYKAVNNNPSIFRYFETLFKLFLLRFKHNPDIYILGFRGHEIFWPVRILTLGKKLIFDELMSPYDALVHELKKFGAKTLIGKLMFALERSMLSASDIIITDTELNVDYYSKLFNIKKFHSVPVGTDENLFKPIENSSNKEKNFKVLFYGYFIPLHGIDLIVKAAKTLEKYPIDFTIIGGKGQPKELKEFRDLSKSLDIKNITHKEWVELKEIPELIVKSDLCLCGAFADTRQSNRVITTKTFQPLAMGKAAVVATIDEEYGFKDKTNCLIVKRGDAGQLSKVILWAYENQSKLSEIGHNGRKLYVEKFSNESISKTLNDLILKVLPPISGQ